MQPERPAPGNPHGYDELPEALKMLYTPKQWEWLGSEGRAIAVERETMPDFTED